MSGTPPPPDVPDEFAETYRAAYEQALREAASATGHRDQPPPVRRLRLRDRLNPPSSLNRPERPQRPQRPGLPALADLRRRSWFLPVVAGVAALVLVLGAYLLGKAFGDDDTPRAASGQQAGQTDRAGHPVYAGDSSTAAPGTAAFAGGGRSWHGAVRPVRIEHATASCTARPGVDSGGTPVTYGAAHVADRHAGTAWRCDGDGRGVTLRLSLAAPARLAEVGLVPGYAKTDPVSHADRYAQNNRITRVRWTIGDVEVVQRLDGDAHHRAVQRLRIPPTTASEVTVEILEVAHGPRNTTAISDVRLAAAPR